MEKGHYTIEVYCETAEDIHGCTVNLYGLRVITSSETVCYPQITTDADWLQKQAELLQQANLFLPHIKDYIEDLVATLVTV